MCNDTRAGSCWRPPRYRDIAEFFIFPRNFGALRLPMQARSRHARGEMAPVRGLQRTIAGVRTWGDNMSTRLDQLAARGKDALPSCRRAGFDNEKHIRGQLPQTFEDDRAVPGSKLIQRVCQSDEVARGALNSCVYIVDTPFNVGTSKLRREPLAISLDYRACFDHQRIVE